MARNIPGNFHSNQMVTVSCPAAMSISPMLTIKFPALKRSVSSTRLMVSRVSVISTSRCLPGSRGIMVKGAMKNWIMIDKAQGSSVSRFNKTGIDPPFANTTALFAVMPSAMPLIAVARACCRIAIKNPIIQMKYRSVKINDNGMFTGFSFLPSRTILERLLYGKQQPFDFRGYFLYYARTPAPAGFQLKS